MLDDTGDPPVPKAPPWPPPSTARSGGELIVASGNGSGVSRAAGRRNEAHAAMVEQLFGGREDEGDEWLQSRPPSCPGWDLPELVEEGEKDAYCGRDKRKAAMPVPDTPVLVFGETMSFEAEERELKARLTEAEKRRQRAVVLIRRHGTESKAAEDKRHWSEVAMEIRADLKELAERRGELASRVGSTAVPSPPNDGAKDECVGEEAPPKEKGVDGKTTDDDIRDDDEASNERVEEKASTREGDTTSFPSPLTGSPVTLAGLLPAVRDGSLLSKADLVEAIAAADGRTTSPSRAMTEIFEDLQSAEAQTGPRLSGRRTDTRRAGTEERLFRRPPDPLGVPQRSQGDQRGLTLAGTNVRGHRVPPDGGGGSGIMAGTDEKGFCRPANLWAPRQSGDEVGKKERHRGPPDPVAGGWLRIVLSKR